MSQLYLEWKHYVTEVVVGSTHMIKGWFSGSPSVTLDEIAATALCKRTFISINNDPHNPSAESIKIIAYNILGKVLLVITSA